MYRILTERKNVETIKSLILDPKFDSYTILDSVGSWRGQHEDSIVIEISPSEEWQIWTDEFRDDVYKAAKEIKELNEQEAVFVQFVQASGELI